MNKIQMIRIIRSVEIDDKSLKEVEDGVCSHCLHTHANFKALNLMKAKEIADKLFEFKHLWDERDEVK